MEYDRETLATSGGYRLLTGLVVPRPIALITTVGANGQVNAAPFSFFNMMGSDPPLVALGISDRRGGEAIPKDSARNMIETGAFVVNFVHEAIADRMNITAVEFGPEVDELAAAGFTSAPSAAVAPVPRIAEARAHLECRFVQEVVVGRNRVLLGEIVHAHVADAFVDPATNRARTDALEFIGRMHGGGWYARTSDLFLLERIPLADWQKHRDE